MLAGSFSDSFSGEKVERQAQAEPLQLRLAVEMLQLQGLLVFAVKPSSPFMVSLSNHELTALGQAQGQRIDYN